MEIAGLAIGVAGLAGLFTTCVDALNLVQTGRSLGKTHNILATRLRNQRLRFVAWGKACGLDKERSPKPGFTPGLEVRMAETMQCIVLLFVDGDKLNQRYERNERKREGHNDTDALTPADRSENNKIFSNTSHGFLLRMSKNNFLNSTLWAISDKKKFTELIDHLDNLIGDLEGFTAEFDLQSRQLEHIQREIQTIHDVHILQTISDARLGDNDAVSDAASRRLISLQQEPGLIADSEVGGQRTESFNDTFHTAPSWPLELEEVEAAPTHDIHNIAEVLVNQNEHHAGLSQNKRLMIPFLEKGRTHDLPTDLSESMKSFGKAIQPLRTEIINRIGDSFPRLEDDQRIKLERFGIAKRVLREIRGFNSIDPSMAGLPVEPLLESFTFMTFFEGPPSTPYAGGIFAVSFTLPADFPFSPPKCRFLTRIYHPNIDPNGQICLDLLGKDWGGVSPMHSILISICSILSEPGLDDPLVHEIAQTYITDREQFNKNAALYTRTYATMEHALSILPKQELG